MDTKNLTSLLSLKTVKFSDVKNLGSFGLTSDEASTKAKNQFSTILAAEDSKNLPLKTEDSTATLSAVDFSQQMVVPIPMAVLYSDPLPLVLAGNTNVAADGNPFSLPVVELEKRFSAEPHADVGFSIAHDLMALPSTFIKSEEIKQPLPTIVLMPIQADDLPVDAKPYANTPPALNSDLRKGPSDGSTDLVKLLTVNLPSHELTINISSPQLANGLGLTPTNLSKPTVKSINVEVDKNILSRSPEKSTLNEVGRKNEALLDVLALGECRAKPVDDESDIKPAIFTFQREAVAEATPLNQSSSTSQTLATESSQVAEKNHYLGVNGPQNISLTLGGLGDETVAVKILVSGLDTQVDIRTDDQALRQMIEGSVQEMKEKLSTEGLTLSGLSVGATSQDQGMGQSSGHGMGRESQRRAAPEDLISQNLSQGTGVKNRVSSTESRPASVGGRKLSVFV